MSAETCHRVGDALAVGQVWGDAALMEHATHCEVCARELAVLKKRREFRDAFPVLSSIADQSERAPTRARVPASEARARIPLRRVFLMIAAVVAIGGYISRHSIFGAPSTPRSADGAPGPPTFRISNLENALFESKTEGGTVRSSMSRGIAAFYVERLGPGQRFLLTLPDGDVEVRGTRFVVSVDGGKTQRVEVSEGTVELRLQGRAAVTLAPGDRWPPASSGRPTLSFMRMAPRRDAAPPEDSSPSD